MMEIIGAIILLFALFVIFLVSRYKRCPSDKILVVYGKTGGGASAKCYAGGAAFVWPVIQDYRYLDLTPLSIDVNLKDALSKQNIRVNVPSQFTVGIGEDEKLMLAAANRLLSLNREQVARLSQDIIMGQMRLVIANMDIEELNTDRDKFVSSVYSNVGEELHKVGLRLINVNVTDIQDESGYIVALGKEAAAKAIEEAKVKVANEQRTGSIGQAEALQDQRTKVAALTAKAEIGEAAAAQEQRIQVAAANSRAQIGEAEAAQEQRIKVADANSRAEIGESKFQAEAQAGKNEAAIKIAESNAARDVALAEANRRATAARQVAEANAQAEAYRAQEAAEKARALKEKAEKEAEQVVQADIERQKAIIAAQAEAERRREIARGEADATLARYQAEAQGMEELLRKQAEGFQKLVSAAGGDPQAAINYLMLDKLEALTRIQTEAIKDLEIEKVVVYDNGNGQGVGNFVQGLYGMMPQLNDFLGQSGMRLPTGLVGEVHPSTNGVAEKPGNGSAPTTKIE
ncbi:SPFH domain-containing protein [Neolewinella lacunae]|uniref:Flotillin family protein n=1 Tax=Neolewinella lacunae TaxID=1517758 RepID=A0A923TBV3_9BACT|nr:flotillin family protein [Neolewinella lacunae]MBC6993027.1 flotillin family protein [Neolewinella lacunae]MDN3635849.1 SPFH domain-containing protein [Neolewinella lacunae]